jgi:pyruvate/2-oxoglutarate dehydrogenase complex dihydrolipoamide acyltransferase (E2) component
VSQELAVPQLGEGLREVRIVEILRRAGDTVARGEPIYVVETDKSTVELEAPYDGTIERWTVSPGDIVPVGAVVARMTMTDGTAPAQPHVPAPAPIVPPTVVIPPRTRAHARDRGISDAELARIPSPTGKLMPADVDAWIARTGSPVAGSAHDQPLSPEQRRLVFFGAIGSGHAGSDGHGPSEVQVLAHTAARIAAGMPRFRSTLVGDDTLRTYDTVNIGIALARPGDELVMAVVRGADRLTLEAFVREARRQMREALRGGDQAGEDTQLFVSHLGREGIHDAVPLLVAPANAILFLGAPRRDGIAQLVLTFDHRVHNGTGAATFLAALRDALQSQGQTPPA